jgi:hypothetical protein
MSMRDLVCLRFSAFCSGLRGDGDADKRQIMN